MSYSLYFFKKETYEGKTFEGEVKVDDMITNSSGRVAVAICNEVEFAVGANTRMIFNEGIQKAKDWINQASREELIIHITRTLYGFAFHWLDEPVDETSETEKIRAVAHAQSEHDFNAYHLFRSTEEKNKAFINAFSRVYP